MNWKSIFFSAKGRIKRSDFWAAWLLILILSAVLNLFGVTSLTYMWALMAKAALDAKRGDRAGDPYYDTKLATGRYFLARVLPEAGAHLAKLKSGAAPVMALQAEAF